MREPGLGVLLRRSLKAGRLRFTTDYSKAVAGAEFVFISIDTPVNDQDEPQLDSVVEAARKVGVNRSGDIVLCVTAQVPVGTCEQLVILASGEKTGKCDVVYIPEYLRLGEAIKTFYRADRFVIGAQSCQIAKRVAELYKPLRRPILLLTLRSAEMAKHACNSFLAASISFINEIGNLCEVAGADAMEVAKAMKLDRRIGPHAFLSPGLGFAGGTLGRDVRALQELARQHSCHTSLMDAVMHVNSERAQLVIERLLNLCTSLQGLRIGVLGLTYKPGTSTLRRSISLEIIAKLATAGAEVRAYDPVADLGSAGPLPEFSVYSDLYSLARACDAIVLVTEWNGTSEIDWVRLRNAMRRPLLIDTRNLLDPAQMSQLGFIYHGIGRSTSSPSGLRSE